MRLQPFKHCHHQRGCNFIVFTDNEVATGTPLLTSVWGKFHPILQPSRDGAEGAPEIYVQVK